MTDIVELLPCPFCGGPVELEQTIDKREWWGVVCRNTMGRGGTCAIQQRPSASKEAAVERWNTRAAYEVMARGDGEAEQVIRNLAGQLYHHAVTKYDPYGAECCVVAAIAALTRGSSGHEG